ncbi:MAG: multidrug ABC transporter ATP-binding protein [SAR86 cluster bacterium]|uniref:Multidrug ABC transporter ATP-binding protein n=1 Tax=SAR86 cluster bacterium TaxID=2030880 RepID=A0A2A5CCL6_9GAMM|nr:ABC transporter ATP-binding protein [Gammaproteobacteria bacterium AH-315-E17]PCJ41116.1 MAG: multidrug ABC transporter ATP-binding protein [SAR86 cluster bacterium]
MSVIISIKNLGKTFKDGFQALKNINLDINKGEIIALLGPNGAGKTTLISAICGIVSPTEGTITVNGFDILKDYRQARAMIGLVPQELTVETFETVTNVLEFSRGLFGKKKDPAQIEKVLRSLSLWEKKDNKLMTLSGGMKRRVLIGKALAHEPDILFLDEPTAGVDVELRKEMWQVIRELRDSGVTVILTTHYIDEAEEMADRIAVINEGQIILVEEKDTLMQKLGEKNLKLHLTEKLTAIPASLVDYNLALSADGMQLQYSYDVQQEDTGITGLLDHIEAANIQYRDLETKQSSLEEIFVNLVKKQ